MTTALSTCFVGQSSSRTARDLVQDEVLTCVSSLVSTLAGVSGMSQSAIDADRGAWELFNAAAELSYPVPDYEEAVRQEGWSNGPDAWPNVPNDERYWGHPNEVEEAGNYRAYKDAQELCDAEGIEPYYLEVFEHWVVTDWLADKLIVKGEKVDKDFAGLCIWARTTTGQAIYCDDVIEQIAADLAREA